MILYKKKIVCFLDILGFKNIILKSQNDLSILRQIQDALTFIKTFKKETNKYNFQINNTEKLVTQFSDSLIISFAVDCEGQFVSTISEINQIIANLILKGFLLRGGIAYGDIVHTANFVYGPAFIEAYELELSAKFPRVILSTSLLNMMISGDEFEFTKNSFLSRDSDGYLYIDYFKPSEEYDNYYEYFIYLDTLRELIIQGLLYNATKIREKYEWMKIRYNEIISLLQKNNQSHLGYDIAAHIKQLFQI